MADGIVGKISVGDGATFTPHVSSAGILTFTNNKNLPNPDPVNIVQSVVDSGGLAPIDSPALTGTPTAPTPTAGDDSTKVATTAFVNTKASDYLPLTGGTMTGELNLATIKNAGTDAVRVSGGSDTNPSTGAMLTLFHKNHTNNGAFRIFASNGSLTKKLEGKPDGTFTWDGKAIWTSKTEAAKRPVLDSNNVLATSDISYQQVGKLVYVNITALRMSSTATTTYNGMKVASGFPVPAFTQRFSPLQVSDESAQPIPSINTSGALYVATRGTSIANKILIGGFVYIAQ